MDTLTRLTRILRDTLMLNDPTERFDPEKRLLGVLPGFDSLAVVSVLTAVEDEFGIVFADDELTAEVFETVGSLEQLVLSKLTE